MKIVGITGGIGSGKSVVSELFSVVNIPVYIADKESKKLTANSPVIREKLIDIFGKELYKEGVLDKKLLASYIFNDKEKLRIVNSIIHPEVKNDFMRWLEINKKEPVVAHEAAILFESGMNTLVDFIVMVYTPVDIRIGRVMKRDGLSREKVLERIGSQMPDEDKAKLSDFVINNGGSVPLISQFLDVLKELDYKI